MKSTIGILLISTWKYNKFIDSVIAEIRTNFFPNSTVKIFLHTDSGHQHDADTTILIEHKPWPEITLKRFNLFLKNKHLYDTDYLFYLDIDTKILNVVDEKILYDFVVTEHSGYKNSRGTPETNPESTAYISNEENITYVCGGFFGGKTKRFLQVCEILSSNIEKDLSNNIIAIWHDESHLNRYYHSNQNTIHLLPPDYMYNGTNKTYKINSPIMVPFSNNTKGFNKFKND